MGNIQFVSWWYLSLWGFLPQALEHMHTPLYWQSIRDTDVDRFKQNYVCAFACLPISIALHSAA